MHRPILLAAILALAACGKPPAPPPAGPPDVQVLALVAEDVPLAPTYVGRTTPDRSVELRARVTGILLERPYKEGEPVKEGDLLFRIDPREFQAAVDSAKAKLAQTEAQVVKTAADLKRTEPLAKAGAASQADLDAAVAASLEANADRDAARASLVKAELDLSFTVIKAPFAGLVSKSTADPGTLISPNLGVLATIDRVDPISVEFTVSEAELVRWRAEITAGRMRNPGTDHLLLKARLVDGSELPETGRLAFRDVRIKPETGTALINATFPNPEGRLRAGQFIRVTVTGATGVGYVLVPQAAVLQTPAGANVYVVDKDGKAEARKVVMGSWFGDRWEVREGLKPGDQLIVDGLQRVRPGLPVKATPWQAPRPDDRTTGRPDDQTPPPAKP
ncbi:MAG: efflux RND transporter periplasmic adaptor subunit [Planctomycetes bacterium]|nr:efflux RND transporter periplasmic adaptor subunit [Planctomycetota bacterium]